MSALARGLVLAVICLSAGCTAGTRSPEGVVRALAEAATDGDRGRVWELLGPETRARLTAAASRAAELGGRRGGRPEEALAVGWFPPRMHLEQVREVERVGDRATVEVRGRHGGRQEVTCVRVAGGWKVELP
jgi:hypothetical protein